MRSLTFNSPSLAYGYRETGFDNGGSRGILFFSVSDGIGSGIDT